MTFAVVEGRGRKMRGAQSLTGYPSKESSAGSHWGEIASRVDPPNCHRYGCGGLRPPVPAAARSRLRHRTLVRIGRIVLVSYAVARAASTGSRSNGDSMLSIAGRSTDPT